MAPLLISVKLLTVDEYLLVNARIEGAFNMQGIRAAVYKRAESYRAQYFGTKERTFYYDEHGNLVIQALFMPADRAGAENFQTALTQWYLENSLVGLEHRVHVEEDIQGVKLSDIVRDSSTPAILSRVFLHDYSGADSESPMSSLDQFRALSISSSSDTQAATDDILKYQSFESPECFQILGAYQMHIKDKAHCSQALKNNSNNLIAGSWTPFHQFFDGLRIVDGIPKLAVKFLQITTEQIIVPGGSKRQRVDVALEFQDEEAAKIFVPRLKQGTKRDTNLSWHSFLHVENATIFQECLQWKYRDTTEKWKEFNAL